MQTIGQALSTQTQAAESGKSRRPHRPRKDYTNLDTVFSSLHALKTALRQYINNATTIDAAPEYVSCAMTLAATTILPLKSPLEGPYAQGGPNFLPFEVLANNENNEPGHSHASAPSQALPGKSIHDLVNIQDLKERQIWQRAAAKGVVNAIQDLDGFKYCFNNNWTSKDDNGYRYSYTCLDSLENKDRHANGFRATNAAKRRPGANTRGVRKPTYDCKGQIAVKFSGVKQSVEVVYKHHPIHKTVAERRPPPRKDSKRRDDHASGSNLNDSTSFDFDAQSADQDETSFLFANATAQDLTPVDPAMTADFQQTLSFNHVPDSHQDEPNPAKKARRRTRDVATPKSKRLKKQSAGVVEMQPRPLSLVEILQQSMTDAPSAPNLHQSPSPSWQADSPLSHPVPLPGPHPGPTGHYQPPPNIISPMLTQTHQPQQQRQQQQAQQPRQPQPPQQHQQSRPRDVGRFSKLAVPCFKCKAVSTECDGQQPVCQSCRVRGTVCNYPSILRFDKQPVDNSQWIHVQPSPQARNVFRAPQTPSTYPANQSQQNVQIADAQDHNSWFQQS